MSEPTTTILWLREDLRLGDNPALDAAARRGRVVPVYIWDDAGESRYPMGGASRWWLQEALKDLSESFATTGAPLILRRGDPAKILRDLIRKTNATHVAWNRRYQPHQSKQDEALAASLIKDGLTVDCYRSYLLFDPAAIRSGKGTPFKVFTPFSKACFAAPGPGKVLPAPQKLQGDGELASDKVDDWKLVPAKAKWPQGLKDAWEVGEEAAQERLQDFISAILAHYKTGRDQPDRDGTSRLSPYLHFGAISPRQVWHAIGEARRKKPDIGSHAERYLLELLWREFSWHLLQHFPDMTHKPLNESFSTFPWKKDMKNLQAWQQGMTGYPIVDAGMRQLWQTGWMHNRVRMITASFLIKDLLIDWRTGAEWFWDTLVDADLGNNTASWQWVAGCGADAAPYFRIFNPTLQGEKFDPCGDYVREFVPELANLDAKYIHQPWTAPAEILKKAGLVLGKTYPLPVIDHGTARMLALAALRQTKNFEKQDTEIKGLFD